MFVKAVSGSRILLTILKNFGHTVSYPVTEELETAAAHTSLSNSNLLPAGIKTDKNPQRLVRACFDNYDLKFKSNATPGKDTVHDTV